MYTVARAAVSALPLSEPAKHYFAYSKLPPVIGPKMHSNISPPRYMSPHLASVPNALN